MKAFPGVPQTLLILFIEVRVPLCLSHDGLQLTFHPLAAQVLGLEVHTGEPFFSQWRQRISSREGTYHS